MSESPLKLNSAELGRMLGIDQRHVRRLHNEGVFPRAGKGRHARFDPYVCVPLFVTYVRQGAEKTVGIAQSRQQLVDVQRRAQELKLRRAEREVIAITEVEQTFEAAMIALAAGLDGLGGRLCGELVAIADPAVIRQRIFDETRRLRNTAADALEALAGAPARSKGLEGAATADTGPVGGRVPNLAAG